MNSAIMEKIWNELLPDSPWAEGIRREGREEGELREARQSLIRRLRNRFPKSRLPASTRSLVCRRSTTPSIVCSRHRQPLRSVPSSRTSPAALRRPAYDVSRATRRTAIGREINAPVNATGQAIKKARIQAAK